MSASGKQLVPLTSDEHSGQPETSLPSQSLGRQLQDPVPLGTTKQEVEDQQPGGALPSEGDKTAQQQEEDLRQQRQQDEGQQQPGEDRQQRQQQTPQASSEPVARPTVGGKASQQDAAEAPVDGSGTEKAAAARSADVGQQAEQGAQRAQQGGDPQQQQLKTEHEGELLGLRHEQGPNKPEDAAPPSVHTPSVEGGVASQQQVLTLGLLHNKLAKLQAAPLLEEGVGQPEEPEEQQQQLSGVQPASNQPQPEEEQPEEQRQQLAGVQPASNQPQPKEEQAQPEEQQEAETAHLAAPVDPAAMDASSPGQLCSGMPSAHAAKPVAGDKAGEPAAAAGTHTHTELGPAKVQVQSPISQQRSGQPSPHQQQPKHEQDQPEPQAVAPRAVEQLPQQQQALDPPLVSQQAEHTQTLKQPEQQQALVQQQGAAAGVELPADQLPTEACQKRRRLALSEPAEGSEVASPKRMPAPSPKRAKQPAKQPLLAASQVVKAKAATPFIIPKRAVPVEQQQQKPQQAAEVPGAAQAQASAATGGFRIPKTAPALVGAPASAPATAPAASPGSKRPRTGGEAALPPSGPLTKQQRTEGLAGRSTQKEPTRKEQRPAAGAQLHVHPQRQPGAKRDKPPPPSDTRCQQLLLDKCTAKLAR
jgi:hypothetical protein